MALGNAVRLAQCTIVHLWIQYSLVVGGLPLETCDGVSIHFKPLSFPRLAFLVITAEQNIPDQVNCFERKSPLQARCNLHFQPMTVQVVRVPVGAGIRKRVTAELSILTGVPD